MRDDKEGQMSKRILIVDDEESLLHNVQAYLDKEACQVK